MKKIVWILRSQLKIKPRVSESNNDSFTIKHTILRNKVTSVKYEDEIMRKIVAIVMLWDIESQLQEIMWDIKLWLWWENYEKVRKIVILYGCNATIFSYDCDFVTFLKSQLREYELQSKDKQ